MEDRRIQSALISVFHKEGLAEIIQELDRLGVRIFSTGGTQKYIEEQGVKVHRVEDLTGYPSILDGRVKTLHPKVFGGILAKRESDHLTQLETYEIPSLDLVIVDLYPFEETVAKTDDESLIIEKIDIGGISLIRAAAKNYKDVVIVPSQNEYSKILDLLRVKNGETSLEDRKWLAMKAFEVSSHYDYHIHSHFAKDEDEKPFKKSLATALPLRYGENPHQKGIYYGELNSLFHKLGGKELSFNNLVDIDAAVQIMSEFQDSAPTFAILKHTNACGVATRDTVNQAWKDALAGDPVSAFGGILICNQAIDLQTAEEINTLFYEVLIAPEFNDDAKELLLKKKKRILLKLNYYPAERKSFKSILNGVIEQDSDLHMELKDDLEIVTEETPTMEQIDDLIFANKCVKHLKSNGIALVKDGQLVGMGCGQTSRVDALKQAISKARNFGLPLEGAVMASDAFFPFPDCVEIAYEAGIKAVTQPGGSIKDQLSIDYCNENGMAMVFTGHRHFKH